MSSAQLTREMAAAREVEGAEAAVPMLRREQGARRTAQRLFAGGGRRADVGIARALGVRGRGDLRRIFAAKTEGGFMAEMQEAMGVEIGDEQRQQLSTIRRLARGEEVVEGQARKATEEEIAAGAGPTVMDERRYSGAAAQREALRRTRDLERGPLGEQMRGRRLESQRQQDPLQDAILSKLEAMAQSLDTMATADKSKEPRPVRVTNPKEIGQEPK
jgi:hypothetical protein